MAVSAARVPDSLAAPSESPRAPSPPRPRDPYPLGIALQALAVYAIVGASLGLFVMTVGLHDAVLSGFLDRNSLAKDARLALLLGLLGGGAGAGVLALSFLLKRGRDGVASLRRSADVIMPLGLVFLFPSLFSARPWHDKPLTYLVQLAASVLALEWTLRRSLAAAPRNVMDWLARVTTFSPAVARWLPLAVVLCGSLLYSIYFSYYTILNHQRLGTSGFDLGINVNWCYNALHGQPFRSTVLYGPSGGNFLGNHAIFAMALWLPLFAIWPTAEFFLVFQATMVGFAATTLYLFAQTQIPRWSAVIVAYAFLFFAPLHGPNFYDYHELLPPLFFHFFLYWAIAKEKNWLVAILVPVLWSFREDIPVGTTVLGLFLVLTGIRPRLGLILAVASVAWFAILKFAIMPMAGQWWFADIYKELQPDGKGGYGAIIQTILTNPSYLLTTLLKEEKLVYFLHMFAPLALLPARRATLLVLAIPGFAFSLLTTGYSPTLSIAFQYTCHSIPYIFAASVLMLRLLGRGEGGVIRRRAALGAVILGVASHSYVFGAVLQHETFVGGFSKIEFKMSEAEKQRYESVKKLAAMIPKDASVAASENEVPHIAARMDAYTMKDGLVVEADYIFVNGPRIGTDGTRKALQTLFAREKYGLVASENGIYLFKRGHDSPETKAAMTALRVNKGRK